MPDTEIISTRDLKALIVMKLQETLIISPLKAIMVSKKIVYGLPLVYLPLIVDHIISRGRINRFIPPDALN